MHVDPLRMAIRPAPNPIGVGFHQIFGYLIDGFGENYKNQIKVG